MRGLCEEYIAAASGSSLDWSSLSGMTHSMGWHGSTSGDVGAGCTDPSMGSTSYNQPNTGPNNGIFVSTYAKTVGDPYHDFGSQN